MCVCCGTVLLLRLCVFCGIVTVCFCGTVDFLACGTVVLLGCAFSVGV